MIARLFPLVILADLAGSCAAPLPDRPLALVEPDERTAAQLRLDPFVLRFRSAKAGADAGDPEAQTTLGELYETAKGAPQDLGMAASLYRAAAQTGDARAALRMGRLIQRLKAMPEWARRGHDDLTGADPVAWLRRAAEAGLPEAQLALAQALRRSRDCTGDWIGWARKAADQGHAPAQLWLGGTLLECGGAARQQGLRTLAAAAGTLPIARVVLFLEDHPAPSAALPDDLPDDVQQSVFAVDLEEMANHSPPDAPLLTAGPILTLMGWAGPDSDARLRRELERRASTGIDLQSACNLAFASLWPVRRENDYASAGTWYSLAAGWGAARAQYHMGKLWRDGHGRTADRAKAAGWFYLAARQDYVPAQAALGDMLLAGDGIPENAAVALSWLRAASAAGHPLATFDLGRMAYDGIAMPLDKPRGLQLIREAASYDAGDAARAWLKQRQLALPGIAYWGPGLDTGTGGCQG